MSFVVSNVECHATEPALRDRHRTSRTRFAAVTWYRARRATTGVEQFKQSSADVVCLVMVATSRCRMGEGRCD